MKGKEKIKTSFNQYNYSQRQLAKAKVKSCSDCGDKFKPTALDHFGRCALCSEIRDQELDDLYGIDYNEISGYD